MLSEHLWLVVCAVVVRLLLVPASMALLGRANWYLPQWLERSSRAWRRTSASGPSRSSAGPGC